MTRGHIYILKLAESSAPWIEDTLQSTKLCPSRIYKQYKQVQIARYVLIFEIKVRWTVGYKT